MNLHLFGASTLVGETFFNLLEMEKTEFKSFLYSRNCNEHINLDLNHHEKFRNYSFGKDSIIVSFCPIWTLAKLIKYLHKKNKYFCEIKSIIVCSSSSSFTKKYSFSSFDKKLSSELNKSENTILDICKKSKISCVILQPSLIYGVYKSHKDKNVSKLISLMRLMPVIILPKNSGKRQPIHAYELSKVTLYFLKKTLNYKKKYSQKLSIGGDNELTYEDLLEEIKKNLPPNDKAKKCKILKVNQKLFIISMIPTALISLKLFESVLRISTNLSGFNSVSQILKIKPSKLFFYRFL